MVMYSSASDSLEELERRARVFVPDPAFPHDPFVLLHELTPGWVELARPPEFAPASCSLELRDLAQQVFLCAANRNTQRLAECSHLHSFCP